MIGTIGSMIGAFLLGGGTVYIIFNFIKTRKLLESERKISQRIKDAEAAADQNMKELEQKTSAFSQQKKQELDLEIQKRRQEIEGVERQIREQAHLIEEKASVIQNKESELNTAIDKSKQLREKQEDVLQSLYAQLEKVATLSKEDAEKLLMANVERATRRQAGKMIKDIESQAQKAAARRSKEIVLSAIQRSAVEYSIESATSVVNLPDDEMKGRIIGKEGRNIRSFEFETGVDVIIDDTPNAVILSAYDPIRREIARISMDLLVKDGRINPSRVEEAVSKAKKQLNEIILEHGEMAAEKLGLQFHPKLKELLGRLHYRTSYGQNMLAHALETSRIAGAIAQELGVNTELAMRGGVLHDIGKAIDFEQEGTHDDLGAEACKKYGESDELLNCIMAHHEDEEPDTVEAVIVMVADAISSSRPGARKESVELYLKRLETLEKIAYEFDGVEKAFAIQAGREVRIIVRPDDVDDDSIHKVALDIAQRIESEVDYPGEVKINIVREVRASSIAK